VRYHTPNDVPLSCFSFRSGAQPITAFPKSVPNKTDVAAAITEYVEDSETESEAENGADDEQIPRILDFPEFIIYFLNAIP
jgi:hypothetical protein